MGRKTKLRITHFGIITRVFESIPGYVDALRVTFACFVNCCYVLQSLNNKLLSLAGASVREYETFKRRSLGQFLYPINNVMDKFMLPACLFVCTRLNLDQVNTITTLEASPDRHWLLPSHPLDKVFPELLKLNIDALMEEPMKTQLDFLKHLYRHLFGSEPTTRGYEEMGHKRKTVATVSQTSEKNETSSEVSKSEAEGDDMMGNSLLPGRTVYKVGEASSPKKKKTDRTERTDTTTKKGVHSTASQMAARGLVNMRAGEAPPFSLFSKTVEFKLPKEARKSITIGEATSIVSALASSLEKADIKKVLETLMGSDGTSPCYDMGGDERICVGHVSLQRLVNVLYAYIQMDSVRSRIKKKQAHVTALQQDIASDTDLMQSFTKQDY
jgi:hypothetical protein